MGCDVDELATQERLWGIGSSQDSRIIGCEEVEVEQS